MGYKIIGEKQKTRLNTQISNFKIVNILVLAEANQPVRSALVQEKLRFTKTRRIGYLNRLEEAGIVKFVNKQKSQLLLEDDWANKLIDYSYNYLKRNPDFREACFREIPSHYDALKIIFSGKQEYAKKYTPGQEKMGKLIMNLYTKNRRILEKECSNAKRFKDTKSHFSIVTSSGLGVSGQESETKRKARELEKRAAEAKFLKDVDLLSSLVKTQMQKLKKYEEFEFAKNMVDFYERDGFHLMTKEILDGKIPAEEIEKAEYQIIGLSIDFYLGKLERCEKMFKLAGKIGKISTHEKSIFSVLVRDAQEFIKNSKEIKEFSQMQETIDPTEKELLKEKARIFFEENLKKWLIAHPEEKEKEQQEGYNYEEDMEKIIMEWIESEMKEIAPIEIHESLDESLGKM